MLDTSNLSTFEYQGNLVSFSSNALALSQIILFLSTVISLTSISTRD